jgi:uncharacterized protein
MQTDLHQLWDLERGAVIVPNLQVVTTLWKRSIGLIGKKSLEATYGMWIAPCGSIHTCLMKFAIDVAFVNEKGEVAHIIRDLKPWRIGAAPAKTNAALELPAGAADRIGLKIGSRLLVAKSGTPDFKPRR